MHNVNRKAEKLFTARTEKKPMVVVPVKKEGGQASKAPTLTVDDYLNIRRQMEPVLEQDNQHFRKIIATMNPRQPEDIFDMFDKLAGLTEKFTKKEEGGSSLLDLIVSLAKLLQGVDIKSLGNLMEQVGKVLSGKQEQQQEVNV